MLIYRIVHKKYSKSLFASGIEGRWNAVGNKVIYCAESIALAFLENMIRRQGIGFNNDFKPGWRDEDNYFQCQQIGNKWYNDGKKLLLKVPSAVLPEGVNSVINTLHSDYKKIKLI